MMRAAKSKHKTTPATCWLGVLGNACAAKGGKAKAREPHESQCDPAGTASPLLPLPPSPKAVLTEQTPPNLPVRTSSASANAGETSADTTATKLKKAAMRFHNGNVGRVEAAGIGEL